MESQQQDKLTGLDAKTLYVIAQRDAYAATLSVYNGKIKLKDTAEWYEKSFGEKHPSHEWHTSE